MGFVVFWVLCGVAAGIANSQREKSAGSGFLLGFLLGPIGLVIVLVGSNPKRERERAEDRALLRQPTPVTRSPDRIPPPPLVAPPTDQVRIAHRGADLGLMHLTRARDMLKSGELTRTESHFFDDACGEWLRLELHPDIWPALGVR